MVNVELSVVFKKTSGDWFKYNIRACIPPHIVLRAQNTTLLKLPCQKKDMGRKSKLANHTNIVLFNGWCEGGSLRGNSKRQRRIDASTDDGDEQTQTCTTVYKSGLTLEQLKRIATGDDNTPITLQIQFSRKCVHMNDFNGGHLSGFARKRKMEEVRND